MEQSGTRAEDACVVVPAYNEGTVIESVLRELREHFGTVVCVDDGSHDDTFAHARAAGVIVIRHPVNLGQGAALQTGITYAARELDAPYVVTFDADGQHDPADAVRMVQRAREAGLDAVLGSRFLDQNSSVPALRRVVLRLGAAFTRASTGLRVTDAHNGLRVFSRTAAGSIRLRQAGMAHASEILGEVARLRMSYAEEPVTIRYTEYSRAKGQSSLNAFNILYDLVTSRLRDQP